MRILVVEDEKKTASLVHKTLAQGKLTTVTVRFPLLEVRLQMKKQIHEQGRSARDIQ
jgi:DNA-binding response OmpR family regulator